MPLLPRIVAPLALSMAVSLAGAGCGSHGTPPSARQSGKLGSSRFTVMSGHIDNASDATAVTAGEAGVLLVFDEPIADFAPDPENLRVTVTATFERGGEVVIGAYGKREDLAGAYGIGAERNGDAFSYSFRHGFTQPADQTGVFPDAPQEPGDDLYFRTEIHTEPPALWAWAPWDEIPADCIAGPVGDSSTSGDDVGSGAYLGLWLRNVTVHGISVLWPTYERC